MKKNKLLVIFFLSCLFSYIIYNYTISNRINVLILGDNYLINNKSKRFGINDFEKIEKVEQQNGIKIIILDKDNLTWESIKEKI